MSSPCDAIIIGGGPAGSTAAALLAKARRNVLVLERERFPRFHIGESLLPFSSEIFARLGIREKLDARFIIKHGAEIVTSSGAHAVKFYFKDGINAPFPTAYHVTRSEFDKLLLDHAREHGAQVREATAVERVDFAADGATGRLCGGEAVRGRFVIDASGRGSLLGSQFQCKQTYPGLQKFAVYAHFDHVDRDPGIDGTLIRMVRAKDRWFWMIPLSAERMSIGVVMESADFKRHKTPPEAFLEAALAEQPVIARRIGRASRVSPVYSSGDYSYRNARMSGDRWLMAGDAAGFIDPIFSTGVFMAMLSGEQAAGAIDRALSAPKEKARRFRAYERNLKSVMALYLRFVKAWYLPHFIEVFVQPETHFGIPEAVNSLLAGNLGKSWAVRWRMELFYLIVKLQKYFPICPRI